MEERPHSGDLELEEDLDEVAATAKGGWVWIPCCAQLQSTSSC